MLPGLPVGALGVLLGELGVAERVAVGLVEPFLVLEGLVLVVAAAGAGHAAATGAGAKSLPRQTFWMQAVAGTWVGSRPYWWG